MQHFSLKQKWCVKGKRVVILGAGLAGLSCAYFLKKEGIESLVFEKDKQYGGLCRSRERQGFRFDFCGHLLHFRTLEGEKLVKDLLRGRLIKHKRKAFVYAFERFIPYPFQAHLAQLPDSVARECLLGLLDAGLNGKAKRNGNFYNWIHAKFGKGIARNFMIPYNEKFWKVGLRGLSSEWADRFIVIPQEKDTLNSFLGDGNGLGYHAHFWYPKNGIGELSQAFASGLKGINLGQTAEAIDLRKRQIRFKEGGVEDFDILISTLPLPQLAKILDPLPDTMRSYFKKLRWISIYNINLGIEGRLAPEKHWIYFPEKQNKFYRVGFFSNFSSSAAPEGKSALYVEISYSKDKPIDKRRIFSQAVNGLIKAGIIDKAKRIKVSQINDIEFAYPVYDRNYKKARDAALKYLDSAGILSTGRFGSWSYIPMEDVMLKSKDLAASICNGHKKTT